MKVIFDEKRSWRCRQQLTDLSNGACARPYARTRDRVYVLSCSLLERGALLPSLLSRSILLSIIIAISFLSIVCLDNEGKLIETIESV